MYDEPDEDDDVSIKRKRKPTDRVQWEVTDRQERESRRLLRKQGEEERSTGKTKSSTSATSHIESFSFSGRDVSLPQKGPIRGRKTTVVTAGLSSRTTRLPLPPTHAKPSASADDFDNFGDSFLPMSMQDLDEEEREAIQRRRERQRHDREDNPLPDHARSIGVANIFDDNENVDVVQRNVSSQGHKRGRSMPLSDDDNDEEPRDRSQFSKRSRAEDSASQPSSRHPSTTLSSHTSSRHPSATPSSRHSSPAPSSDEGGHGNDVLPRRKEGSTGELKISNYVKAVGTLFTPANARFRVAAITRGIWADDIDLTGWAKESWQTVKRARSSRITYDDGIVELMKGRISTTTGDVKTGVASHVDNLYGFKESTHPRIQAQNQALAEHLLDDFTMCYAEIGSVDKRVPRSGLYEHPIMQKALSTIWFKDAKDLGPRHWEMFDPFPIATMALIWTAVQWRIDEWKVDGSRKTIEFNRHDYREVFDSHVRNMENFAKECKDADSDMFDVIRSDYLENSLELSGFKKPQQSRKAPAKIIARSEFQKAISSYRARRSQVPSEAGASAGDDLEDPEY